MPQTDDNRDDLKDPTPPVVDEPKVDDDGNPEVDEPVVEKEQVDYKNKFSQSAKEAIRLSKETEKLRLEKQLADKKIEVAKDTNRIHDIARDNPELADEICQDFWGKNYAQAVGGDDPEKTAEIDVESKVRKVYREEKARDEKKRIEDYEVQFFIDNNIPIGSVKYNKVISTYSKTKPETLTDAQDLLSMSYKHNFPEVEIDLPQPNTDFGSKSKVKTGEFTEEDKNLMKEKGWDEAKMRKFKSSSLYP